MLVPRMQIIFIACIITHDHFRVSGTPRKILRLAQKRPLAVYGDRAAALVARQLNNQKIKAALSPMPAPVVNQILQQFLIPFRP